MIVTYSIVDNNFLDTVQNGVKANLVSFLEKNYNLISQDAYDEAFIVSVQYNIESARFLVENNKNLISQNAYNEGFKRSAFNNVELAKFLVEKNRELISQESYIWVMKNVILKECENKDVLNSVFATKSRMMKYLLETPDLVSQDAYYRILLDHNEKGNIYLTNFLVENAPQIAPVTYQRIFDYALTANNKYAFYLMQKGLVDYPYAKFRQELLSAKFKCEKEYSTSPAQCITEEELYNIINDMLPRTNPYTKDVCDYTELVELLKRSPVLSNIFYTVFLNKPIIEFSAIRPPAHFISEENKIELNFRSSFKAGKDEFLIHELAHASMEYLFNNLVNPYNNATDLALYNNAIDKMLNNMVDHFIGVDNELNFSSTFEKGRWLMSELSRSNKEDCAVKQLEFLYNGSYGPEDEHVELIVRYPQIIANGCYEQNPIAKEIFAPIAQYWDEVITPAMALHNEWHDWSV